MRRQLAAINLSQLDALSPVGFWWSEEGPDLPHPRDLVDGSWDEAERRMVIAYLESSYLMPYVSCGPSWCRLGCQGVPADIGSQDLTDGTWLFPEGLIHYLRHHGVKPPEDFLEHLRRNGFSVPDLPAIVPGSGEAPVIRLDIGPIVDYRHVLTLRVPTIRLASALGIVGGTGKTLDEIEALDHFVEELNAAFGHPRSEGGGRPRQVGGGTPIAGRIMWSCPYARIEEIEEIEEYELLTFSAKTNDPVGAFECVKPELAALGLLPATTAAFRPSTRTYRPDSSADYEVIWPPGGRFHPGA